MQGAGLRPLFVDDCGLYYVGQSICGILNPQSSANKGTNKVRNLKPGWEVLRAKETLYDEKGL
jgi:hypothetical protein